MMRMKTRRTEEIMNKKQNEYKYHKICTMSDIRAEKERLRRKIKKQEKKLKNDWEHIEKSWNVVGKIVGLGSRLLSSLSLLGGAELGYKIISYFFPEKKQKT